MKRRYFLTTTAATAGSLALGRRLLAADTATDVPAWLTGLESAYAKDPRAPIPGCSRR